MPVLLGLEVAALSAVAYKLPAVRATARESASYLYETLVGSEPAVSPVEADDRQPASSSPSSPPRKKQPPPPAATVMLPTLYANPEAALSSPLRLKGVLTQIANAVPRRFGGDVGGQWHLLFSTATDGTSLAHMIRTCAGDAALLLVVRDPSGRVYGAFCPVLREPSTGGGGGLGIAAAVESGGEILGTNAAAVGGNTDSSSGSSTSSSKFHGTGETFLFALADLALPPPPEHQISSPSPGATRRGVSRTVAYTFGWSRSDESNEVTEGGFERAPVLSCSCLTDRLLSLIPLLSHSISCARITTASISAPAASQVWA